MMKVCKLLATTAAMASAYAPTGWRPSRVSRGALRPTAPVHVRLPWRHKAEAGGGDNDDITNSPVFLAKKLEVLEKELGTIDDDIAAVEAQRADAWAEWGGQIEGMKKEFDAVKKRTQDARKMAETVERVAVLDQLLGVTDNFDRALAVPRDDAPGVAAIADRYATDVASALAGAFEELGAVKIDEVGAAFDPAIHEACMTAPDDEIPADHVQKVFQYGMKVGDRLIRPATVVVSEGPM